jgi:hypothetical protein
MSRSCATPVIFHYLDRLAGRAAQHKQLRMHSKSWDCSDVLHGVAARERHTRVGVQSTAPAHSSLHRRPFLGGYVHDNIREPRTR